MIRSIAVMIVALFVAGTTMGGGLGEGKGNTVSFKKDVFPIIKQYCLPCHALEEFNPSELSLDSYELLIQGGKNGPAVKKGSAEESLLIRKLSEDPPKGDRMPLNDKKLIESGKALWMADEEVEVITKWIDQGAKDN